MAEITFKPNRLRFVGGEMFAIVTAETPRPIFVANVVRVRGPIQFLVGIVNCRICVFQHLDRVLHRGCILFVIIREVLLIELRQIVDGLIGFFCRLVKRRENFNAFFLDFGNSRIYIFGLQGSVQRGVGR